MSFCHMVEDSWMTRHSMAILDHPAFSMQVDTKHDTARGKPYRTIANLRLGLLAKELEHKGARTKLSP